MAVATPTRTQELDDTILWARRMLASDALILDTETTDLYGYIVEIAIIRMDGSVVYESLINPQAPIHASHIHGITRDMVWSAPTFADVEPQLRRLLHGRTAVVYNAGYDSEVLASEIRRLGSLDREARVWLVFQDWGEWGNNNIYLHTWQGKPRWLRVDEQELDRYYGLIDEHATWWRDRITWECAMLPYSTFVGDWHDYYGNYRYQALRGGHRAAGDCRACLEVIKRMAASKLSTEKEAT